MPFQIPVLEESEYFVYFDSSKTGRWDGRSDQGLKRCLEQSSKKKVGLLRLQ